MLGPCVLTTACLPEILDHLDLRPFLGLGSLSQWVAAVPSVGGLYLSPLLNSPPFPLSLLVLLSVRQSPGLNVYKNSKPCSPVCGSRKANQGCSLSYSSIRKKNTDHRFSLGLSLSISAYGLGLPEQSLDEDYLQ